MKTVLSLILSISILVSCSAQTDAPQQSRTPTPTPTATPIEGTVSEQFATAEDGTPLIWTVFTPNTPPPWDVVVSIPGGGFKFKENSPQQQQFDTDMQNAGDVVVHIMYRLAPGGDVVQGQTSKGYYPDCYNDVKRAVLAARNPPASSILYGNVSGKVAAVGGSAGGSLSTVVAQDTITEVTPIKWSAKDRVLGSVSLSGALSFDDTVPSPSLLPYQAIVTNFCDVSNPPGPTDLATLHAESPDNLISGDARPEMILNGVSENMPEQAGYDMPVSILKLKSVSNYVAILDSDPKTGQLHAWARYPYFKTQIIPFVQNLFITAPTPTPTPTATPDPTPTPTPTPDPTATPSPFSTPTPIPSNITGTVDLIPQGYKVTGKETGWARSYIAGERYRDTWARMEPTEGKIDFSYLDLALAKAHATGKILGVSFAAAASFPPWLKPDGGKTVTLSGVEVALMWDSVVIKKYAEFIRAIAAHVNSQANGGFSYVVIGGLGGSSLNTEMAKSQSDIATLDALGGLNAWSDACDTIISIYNQAFRCPIVVAASAPPYATTTGAAALQSMVDRNASLYANLSVMNTSLRAKPGNGLPFRLLIQYSTTPHVTLVQFVSASGGTGGGGIGGTFAQAMAVGASYHVNIIEIYPGDDNDANAADIIATNALLR
jgi:Beta-galactosidase